MVWESKPIKHFLKIIHIGEYGIDLTTSEKYIPKKYSTDISLNLSETDKELRVKPYTLEHLKQIVEEEYPNGIVNELFIGIKDGVSIAYFGEFWTSKQFKNRSISQYFFEDDQPSGHNFGYLSGPGWPLNQPPMVDERLRSYLEELKAIRPGAADSLDKCIELLSQPGPEYTKDSDGIMLRFKSRR